MEITQSRTTKVAIKIISVEVVIRLVTQRISKRCVRNVCKSHHQVHVVFSKTPILTGNSQGFPCQRICSLKIFSPAEVLLAEKPRGTNPM